MAATKTNSRLTVEQILIGTTLGRPQSVGYMDVIPVIDGGDAQDDTFSPPDINARTSGYGTVVLHNEDTSHPTIVPTGSGWVTEQKAQDHAVPSAYLMKPGDTKTIDKAMCIQSSQGGLIQGEKDFIILPAALRSVALASRNLSGYNRLWESIGAFNKKLDVPDYGGHLVLFLKQYEKELDEFVAEFELMPDQIGAIILINGKVIGVERAPTVAFWKKLWSPLIRVCYGSAALEASRKLKTVSATKTMLNVKEKSLAGIAAALKEASLESTALILDSYNQVKDNPLLLTGGTDGTLAGGIQLITIANKALAGQIVEKGTKVPYVSICAS